MVRTYWTQVLLGQKYTHKADSWSFGVVCWELLTARIPFDGMGRAELARKVAIDGLRLPPPPDTPLVLLKLMASLWLAPRKRPEFTQVVSRLDQACRELGPSKTEALS